MKKRIEWIDILKGFLIITVMLGHILETPYWLKCFIYSFHMPLFFFLSGYTLKLNEIDFKNFSKNKFNSFIIPGIYFMVILDLLKLIFSKSDFTIKKIFLGIILQMRGQGLEIAYFLVALFLSELALYIIIKKLKDNKKTVSIVLLFLSFLNFIYINLFKNILPSIVLPYSLDIIFLICPFLYIGYLCKGKNNIFLIKNEFLTFIASFIIGILLIILTFIIFNGYFDLYMDNIKSYVLYYLLAIFQMNWLLIIFSKIKHSIILKYIGYNSMIYYVFHSTVLEYLTKIKPFLNLNDISFLLFEITSLIIICTFITIIINNYFPFIIKRKKCI